MSVDIKVVACRSELECTSTKIISLLRIVPKISGESSHPEDTEFSAQRLTLIAMQNQCVLLTGYDVDIERGKIERNPVRTSAAGARARKCRERNRCAAKNCHRADDFTLVCAGLDFQDEVILRADVHVEVVPTSIAVMSWINPSYAAQRPVIRSRLSGYRVHYSVLCFGAAYFALMS